MSASVFPARAGMSPAHTWATQPNGGVPRASGDEPVRLAAVLRLHQCSPRERG